MSAMSRALSMKDLTERSGRREEMAMSENKDFSSKDIDDKIEVNL